MGFSAQRVALCVGVSAMTLWLPGLASAQEASSAPDQGEAQTALEDIIVTAQKRSESVNDIPISITAIGGSELERLGVRSTDDLIKIVPALSVAKSQSNTPIYTLRGVGFQNQNLTSTSPVGIYVDEVAYAYPYMGSDIAFDLERVEVLKGPQGLLYGRSTTGGVVNYITGKPKGTTEGAVTFEIGNYETYGIQGYVTGPITSTLSYRVAGKVELALDGWQRSVTRPDDRLGERNRKALRASLLWEPTTDFSALLAIAYWRDQSDTQAPQAIRYVPGNPAFPDPRVNASLIPNPTNSRDADWTPADYQPTATRTRPPFKADGEFYGINLRLNYSLSDAIEVTSLTSYGDVRRNDVTSVDGVATEILTNGNPGRIKSFSQELRLSGDTDTFKWQLGGYFSEDRLRENVIAYTYDASAAIGIRSLATLLKVNPELAATIVGIPAPARPGFIALAGINTAAYSVPDLAVNGFQTNNFGLQGVARTYGAFANGDIQLSDKIAINIGARYTRDTASNTGCVFDIDGNNDAFAAFVGTLILRQPTTITPGQCLTLENDLSAFSDPIEGRLSQDNLSFRTAINWTPRPGLLGYASFSRGYKAGGFPALPANIAAQLDPVTQERLDAFELGVKASLFDRRVQFNAATFYYDYTDKQVYAKIPDIIFGTLNRLLNVPKSEVYGAEAELTVAVTEGLRLRGAATYVHSEVREFNAFDDSGTPRNFAGAALTYTPEWSVVGALDYNYPISTDLELQFNVNANYQSSSNGRFEGGTTTPAQAANDAFFRIKGRTVVDATIGLNADGWRLEAYARNLFDTYYWNTADSQLDTVFRFAGMPRTYGARLTFNF
ncbi:TonB-dependent receptor [Sphingomonas sp. BGYR3]|uniref:TonB-dependent receptor n=1 Tax=Sphingomonas sp. BGYR3 TaxID=2975483 RepID=UPI0021A3A97A|nr:TonB-dependent receptor [Sphingomonas sp. BGYR3]MDG5487757.1 TonB-dependent receptor [Sphingomonas sp. BGYR3]